MKLVGLETISLLTRLPFRGDTFGRTGAPFAAALCAGCERKSSYLGPAIGSSLGGPQSRRDAVAVVAGIMASKS